MGKIKKRLWKNLTLFRREGSGEPLNWGNRRFPRFGRKGQYITLENLLFFAIGIVMITAVYLVFSDISGKMHTAALQDQLAKEGESIRADIINAFTAGNSTNSSVTLTSPIPMQLSECVYKITAGGGYLYITCVDSGDSKALDLYGIETRIKNDAAYSSSGKIDILYSGGSVLIS